MDNWKLRNTTDNFSASKIEHFKENWENITSDKWILNTISGYQVELENKPIQSTTPTPFKFDNVEKTLIDAEIDRFLSFKVIEVAVSDDENDEFISNIIL